MLLSLWPGWSKDWLLEHKVSFDGASRVIYVHPEVTTLNVKADLYSAWKEWTLLRDNSKFTAALRTVGGDPLGSGQFAGDMYFLINGWRVFVDHAVSIAGVLFTEEGANPYITPPSANVIRASVSSLVLAQSTGGTSDGLAADEREKLMSLQNGLTPDQAAQMQAILTLIQSLPEAVKRKLLPFL